MPTTYFAKKHLFSLSTLWLLDRKWTSCGDLLTREKRDGSSQKQFGTYFNFFGEEFKRFGEEFLPFTMCVSISPKSPSFIQRLLLLLRH